MRCPMNARDRHFLFLQGPHGPFFNALGARLRETGAGVARIGFNAGDEAFWSGPGYAPFNSDYEIWPEFLAEFTAKHGITDVVCYGASRPIHKIARAQAADQNLTMHVFEEGYLRPYWVTYERDGANASSPLMNLSLRDMADALKGRTPNLTEAPDRWGDMREHMFWGAAYHFALFMGRKSYPGFRAHRTPDVRGEFWLHLRRFLSTPVRASMRSLATTRLRFGGYPYHLVLLQLAHDANFRDYGPFPNQKAFLETVFQGFSQGAPGHHHLVLKAHPLEDNREPLKPLINSLTRKHGLQGRVHFLTGGKLARVLDSASSATTVNSTSAEQVLWRGLPLKAFGQSVYNRPEFVSNQPLPEFFANPQTPDHKNYLIYRAFMLATSQVPGGFYAMRNRRKLLRQLPDLMLNPETPYARLQSTPNQDAAHQQHLRLL